MANKTDFFPKYQQLSFGEKLFLNTCCYFPPKPRRKRGIEIEINIEAYQEKFINAYGKSNWQDLNHKRVLDFGCGEGGFSVAIANAFPAAEVVGVDILSAQYQANQLKAKLGLTNLEFVVGRSDGLADASFDYVFSHDSFEHFEDPHFILTEMIRLLKPGGFLLIKFGPTWAGPYGRHMSGTIRKDRPWVHLLVPERTIMRAHSVYHNDEVLYEKYRDLEGGLNKMTIGKALSILRSFDAVKIVDKHVKYLWKTDFVKQIPLLNELFSSSLYVKLQKK